MSNTSPHRDGAFEPPTVDRSKIICADRVRATARPDETDRTKEERKMPAPRRVARRTARRTASRQAGAAPPPETAPAPPPAAPTEPVAPAAPAEPAYMAELEQLNQLKEQGILTEEDYEAKKK